MEQKKTKETKAKIMAKRKHDTKKAVHGLIKSIYAKIRYSKVF